MTHDAITDWLLKGDVSIQYQTYRDLLEADRPDLRSRIAHEGWGARFLSKRKPDGHWGRTFYQPKWISTHYTLLDLKNLGIDPNHDLIRESVSKVARSEKGPDGGIDPSRTIGKSDVCVNGMFMNYSCYFGIDDMHLNSVVDFVLSQSLPDGGFNCHFNRVGARHSSLHSTLSVLEGIHEYLSNGYKYRKDEIECAERTAQEFVLMHQLFISDRTGEIIKKSFLKLSYPSRWYYDILRALDYFQSCNFQWAPRMQPAVDVVLKKRSKDGRWKLQANHPGATHFAMEKVGEPSRWNTLRALRVLKHFDINPAALTQTFSVSAVKQ